MTEKCMHKTIPQSLFKNHENTDMGRLKISISDLPLLITVRSDPEQISSTM